MQNDLSLLYAISCNMCCIKLFRTLNSSEMIQIRYHIYSRKIGIIYHFMIF